MLLYGLGAAPAEAADMCQPAETVLDRPDSDDSCNPKKRTIDDTRSARSETRSPGTRSPRNEAPGRDRSGSSPRGEAPRSPRRCPATARS